VGRGFRPAPAAPERLRVEGAFHPNSSGLAEDINPQVRGWINYYGAFYRSEFV
jgi:hypothetical protein